MHSNVVLVFFVVFLLEWAQGSLKVNNSKICYYVQRNLIHELSFVSNLLRTSSLLDMFPKKFNFTSIELRDLVRSKQYLRHFYVTSVLQSKNSFPVHETQIYFKKGGKLL